MSAKELSDADLAIAARAGDACTLAEIHRRFSPLVTAIARRRLRRPTDIEDVVQETFLIVFGTLDELDDASRLRAWIHGIARRRAHRRARTRERARGTATLVFQQLGFTRRQLA